MLSLFVLIIIHGYGFKMRGKSNHFRYNIYFLQLIFILIKILMYFILYPILIKFNPPIWHPEAYTEFNMNIVAIFTKRSGSRYHYGSFKRCPALNSRHQKNIQAENQKRLSIQHFGNGRNNYFRNVLFLNDLMAPILYC